VSCVTGDGTAGDGTACQCRRSGLARTLPRQRPYAGGGLGRSFRSLSHSAGVDSTAVDGWASRESGRTSSEVTFTGIGVAGTKSAEFSESVGCWRGR